MRFRPNGTKLARGILRAAAVIIAVSATIAYAPIAAQAAYPNSSMSMSMSMVDTRTRLVPKVVGWTAADAVTALHSRGFGYSLKTLNHHTVRTPSHWTVTKQSPRSRTHAKVGSRIILTVIKTSTYITQGVRKFYSQNYGRFAQISQGGTGTAVIQLPKGITSAIVRSDYSGGGRFTIAELGKGNVPTKRLLVSSTTDYLGSAALGLAQVKVPTTAIRVSGSGTWRVTIAPISSAPIIAVPTKGKGDRVYLYSGSSVTWTVSSPGATTFMLNQFSSSSYPNLAVDESGAWAGPVALQPGPSVVEIQSNGAWTIH